MRVENKTNISSIDSINLPYKPLLTKKYRKPGEKNKTNISSIKSINLPIYKPLLIKKYRKPIIFKHKSALKGYLKTFRINGKIGYDSKSFLKTNNSRIIKFIESQKKPIKLKLNLTCEFKKIIKKRKKLIWMFIFILK